MQIQSIPGERLRFGCRHAVHYYADAFPADAACEFIAAGLRAGHACVVMLVEPHRRAVEQALKVRGVYLEPGARASGSYLALDTAAALSGLLVDGRLDMARATAALNALLSPPLDVPDHQRLSIQIVGSVDRGEICVGVLDGAQQKWLLAPTQARVGLLTDTNSYRQVRIVFSNCAHPPGEFTVKSISYQAFPLEP